MPLLKKILTSIEASAPVAFIIKKSKSTSLPGFNGIPLFDVINFFIGQIKTIGMTERASAIAFNFVMAIPPAITYPLYTHHRFISAGNVQPDKRCDTRGKG